MFVFIVDAEYCNYFKLLRLSIDDHFIHWFVTLHFLDSSGITQRNKSTRIWGTWLEWRRAPDVQLGVYFRMENKIEMRMRMRINTSDMEVSILYSVRGCHISSVSMASQRIGASAIDMHSNCIACRHRLQLTMYCTRVGNKLRSGLDSALHSVWRLSKSFLDLCVQEMVSPMFQTVYGVSRRRTALFRVCV